MSLPFHGGFDSDAWSPYRNMPRIRGGQLHLQLIGDIPKGGRKGEDKKMLRLRREARKQGCAFSPPTLRPSNIQGLIQDLAKHVERLREVAEPAALTWDSKVLHKIGAGGIDPPPRDFRLSRRQSESLERVLGKTDNRKRVDRKHFQPGGKYRGEHDHPSTYMPVSG